MSDEDDDYYEDYYESDEDHQDAEPEERDPIMEIGIVMLFNDILKFLFG